jgi:dTDP-4-dehydrorhamnose reductase
MPIAIFGGRGQLAGELRYRLGAKAIAFGREQIDITNPAQIETALSQNGIDAVINCAAYNAVDLAESEPETAFRINALGPRWLAAFCERNRIPLVHISTDYVFGLDTGRQMPYRETDLPGAAPALSLGDRLSSNDRDGSR